MIPLMEGQPLPISALPVCITTYFQAVNHRKGGEAAACFSFDAVVHDEEQDRIGRDAIYVWIEETSRQYQQQAELLDATAAGNQFSVIARVSGSFPGSPVELQYDFTVADELITRLEID